MKHSILSEESSIQIESVKILTINPTHSIGYIISIKTDTFKPKLLLQSPHTFDITGGISEREGFDTSAITTIILEPETDEEKEFLDNATLFSTIEQHGYSFNLIIVDLDKTSLLEKPSTESETSVPISDDEDEEYDTDDDEDFEEDEEKEYDEEVYEDDFEYDAEENELSDDEEDISSLDALENDVVEDAYDEPTEEDSYEEHSSDKTVPINIFEVEPESETDPLTIEPIESENIF